MLANEIRILHFECFAEKTNFLAAMQRPPQPSSGSTRIRTKSSGQVSGKKGADRRCDFRRMGLEREMASVEKTYFGFRDIAPERFRAGRQEERIVLAPYRQ